MIGRDRCLCLLLFSKGPKGGEGVREGEGGTGGAFLRACIRSSEAKDRLDG